MTSPRSVANSTGSSDQVLGQLVEELTAKLQAGEPIDLESCIQENPQYAIQLRQLLPALEMLADLGHSAAAGRGEVVAVAAPPDEILGTLGDFRIQREIGRGGMGVVYEAVQISLNRRVALKVLPFAAALDGKQLQRFKNESQAAAQLHHTNIVPVFGVGCERGVHFYAMQYIEGQTLAKVISDLRLQIADSPETPKSRACEPGEPATGPYQPAPADPQSAICNLESAMGASSPIAALSTERSTRSRGFFRTVAQIGVQAGLALEHAHQFGVIHRDIKPANLLLDERGSLWVTDFGLAHCQSQAGLTMTGDLLGTLRYMSPEQALAKCVVVDHRTDIYSLGVTLYELLTQEFAFPGKDRQEVLRQIAFEEPRVPRRLNNAIPAELETIVLKAMAKSPAERYATAQELADDLQRFLDDKPIRAKRSTMVQRIRKWARRKPALAGVVALTGLALLLSAGSLGLVVLSTQLNKALGKAEEAQKNEEKQRQKAEALNNTLQILLASQAWQEGELSLCEQHLEACQAEYRRSWEWQFLKHQCHLDLRTLRGHDGGVNGLAFSPDGRQLVSSSLDGTVKVWDVVTGRVERTLPGAGGELNHVAFSSDGNYIAANSLDGTVYLWNAKTWQEQRLRAGRSDYGSVAFSPDGRHIAAGGPENSVMVWDTATHQETHRFPGHRKSISAVAFAPGGARLASAAEDGGVKVWDLGTGRESVSVKSHSAIVNRLAFSPDGARLASASDDNLVTVWEMTTGLEALVLRGHSNGVYTVAFSPDGKRIASGGQDQTTRIWDAVTGRLERILRGHGNVVYDVAFSPDGTRLISGNQDRTIKFWDVTAKPETLTLAAHAGQALSVAFRPGRGQLASAGSDGTVKLWDLTTGLESRPRLEGHAKNIEVACVAFSPDGSRLASAGTDRHVNVWDAETGRRVWHSASHAKEVWSVGFSRDGNRLVSGDASGTLKVWKAATGKELQSYQAHQHELRCVAFGPDDKLASASADRSIKIWEPTSAQLLHELPGHHCWVYSVAFSPDWTHLAAGLVPDSSAGRVASASGDGTVAIWDALTGDRLFSLAGHGNDIRTVAFTPDGTRLASASSDKTVKIWNVSTGQDVLRLKGYPAGVSSVTFSSDGTRLASACLDGTVKIWDARPLTPELFIEREALGLLGHLFAKPLCKADVADCLRSSPTISHEVRDKALVLIDSHQEETKPEAYQQAAWANVRQPYLNKFQYGFALRQAETASRLAPQQREYWAMLGMAQYRAGRFRDALASLTRAGDGNRDVPAGLAFLAMAQYRLEQKKDAQATLSLLRQAIRQPRWTQDKEMHGFLREAETLISSR